LGTVVPWPLSTSDEVMSLRVLPDIRARLTLSVTPQGTVANDD
jgi:hypothetical protein